MERINFDKTIDYSRKLVNGEMHAPQSFILNKICGGLYSYQCGGSCEIPADHIGLSYLIYSQVVDSLSITKVNEDGSIIKEFERADDLSTLDVTSFMQSINPNVLSWYSDRSGNPVRLSKFGSKINRVNEFTSNEVVDANPQTGENYREIAMRGAFCAALKDYVMQSTDWNSEELTSQSQEEILTFVSTQLDNFENSLAKLKGEDLIPQGESEGQVEA